ncbi:MAG: nucleoside triphosphate pyrophosphohydrolase, partial [Rhodovibrionaceae bacterium]|nr:nucleoside triphosphate pyrophosphohydrolase [Rhodovibrionaceae bacterium]
LLLQVAYHARMAEERGAFDFSDVAAQIADKMIRRHPHVFGNDSVPDADAQTLAWEEQKAAEREAAATARGRRPSALDGLALGLPALLRAYKLQRRAARVGFDWAADGDVLDKVEEEFRELRAEINGGAPHAAVSEEFGDLLFAMVNLGRRLGVEPEEALREATAKFERRFRAVEDRLAADGRSPAESDLAEMDRHWDEIKKQERKTEN